MFDDLKYFIALFRDLEGFIVMLLELHDDVTKSLDDKISRNRNTQLNDMQATKS